MMRLEPGQRAPEIICETYDGQPFKLSSLQGQKVFISFFRFATCPFCNLRLNRLINHPERITSQIKTVALFESTKQNMLRHAPKHKAPFPMISDRNRTFYKAYGLEKSLWGMLRGLVLRFHTVMYSMIFKGNIPWPIDSSMLRMPANFLVDEKGIIQVAYYGQDEGDHMPFERVLEFVRKA